MKNYISILIVAVAMIVASCSKDDLTGHSTSVAVTPNISITAPSITAVTDEAESEFVYTVTLSEPAITDVIFWITQTDGDATWGVDFDAPTKIVLPAFTTTTSFSVAILADEDAEEQETFTLQIGDDRTANAVLAPITATFTINNYSADDLTLDLSWFTADVFMSDGHTYDATDVADLILTIYDGTGTQFAQADGASFETLTIASTDPDGTYRVDASIFGTVTLLAGETLPPASVTIEYDQPGIQHNSVTFEGVLDLEQICAGNSYAIVEVVKAGNTYTVNNLGNFPFIPSTTAAMVGNFAGEDVHLPGFGDYRGVSQIVGSLNGAQLQMSGFNVDFMEGPWGEAILTSNAVDVNIDFSTNTLTIPDQPIFSTDFPSDYRITGTGRLEPCQLIIEYEVTDDTGFEVGAWLNANGFMDDALLTATLQYP